VVIIGARRAAKSCGLVSELLSVMFLSTMAIVYVVVPLMLVAVVLAAVWLERWSVPVILIALALGILFGSDVLNVWHFDDVELTNQVANVALVFILFQGGFSTKREDLRAVALPAGGLATWGVLLTSAVTFTCLHFVLGWTVQRSLLLAVIISSTDAAATFSILRRQALPRRLTSTIEIESAANDPMAILTTLIVVEGYAFGESHGWLTVPLFLWMFVAGPVFGWLIARGSVAVFDRLNPQDRGYYYVLLVGIVLLTYGLTEMANASGMLAVFTAGLVMGNIRFVYRQGVRNFAAALSMIANIGVFVLMGVLVFPHQWAELWLDGVLLFAVLAFVARPAAVWLGTLGMRIRIRERMFISWAGLRGAVPIVLATYPMAAGLEIGEEVFNLVFFAVLLSVSIQGSTLGALARGLGLSEPQRPQPRYGLELVTMAHSGLDLFVVDLPGPKGRPGPRVRDLILPPTTLITLIARGNEVVGPTGNTRLLGWDQVTVLARQEDEEVVRTAMLRPFLTAEPGVAPEHGDASGPPIADAIGQLSGHIVLVGHGRVGAVIAQLLRRCGLVFVVVEQDGHIVDLLRKSGTLALAGQGQSPEVLDEARIAGARLLLVTTADPISARVAIEHAHRVNATIQAIVRVHFAEQRDLLGTFPRTHCVHGEEELAYAMARSALNALGVGDDEIENRLLEARGNRNRASSEP
jgi:cell volume regulation protein A